MRAPGSWRRLDFYEFNSEDSKSIMEHVGLFLTKIGEAITLDFMNACNFFIVSYCCSFLDLLHCCLVPLVLGLK